MKTVNKVFLIIAMVSAIISAVGLGIWGILLSSGAVDSIVISIVNNVGEINGDEFNEAILRAITLSMGIIFLISMCCLIIGAVAAKKALNTLGTDEMSIGLGVVLIIFAGVPFGVLYLIYRSMYFNRKSQVRYEI